MKTTGAGGVVEAPVLRRRGASGGPRRAGVHLQAALQGPVGVRRVRAEAPDPTRPAHTAQSPATAVTALSDASRRLAFELSSGVPHITVRPCPTTARRTF